MKDQNITSIPNSNSFCKAEKQHEHENIHVHEMWINKTKVILLFLYDRMGGLRSSLGIYDYYEASYLEIEVSIFE